MSYFIIKFFQNFSSVSLAPEVQPPNSMPPSSWASAEGRKGIEKIMPEAHLSMYTLVSSRITGLSVELHG